MSEIVKATPPAELGEVIGAYRLERVIGQGGMGCVYAAVHSRLGRRAAVKVLSGALAADSSYVSRFFHEAKIVNDIQHPNIIDIIDFIEQKEPLRVAYVMELLSGPSLGASLKVRRLSWVQAANIGLQLAGALEAVHNVGVVHRDLKPDNIIIITPLAMDLSLRPSIKVLDFGIAKSSDPDLDHHTAPGAMIGTPMYMAPEQVIGAAVSPATDVYAFGEILYEMLAGKRLFSGDVPTVLAMKMRHEIPEARLAEETPGRERLEALIRGCVAAKPSDRPSLAAAVGILLELLQRQGLHSISAEQSEVHASGELDPLKTAVDQNLSGIAPRRPAVVFGVAAALGLAIAGIGVVYAVRHETKTEPLSAQEARGVDEIGDRARPDPTTSTVAAQAKAAATSTTVDRAKPAPPRAPPAGGKEPRSSRKPPRPAASPARTRDERAPPKKEALEEPEPRAKEPAEEPRPLKKTEVPSW